MRSSGGEVERLEGRGGRRLRLRMVSQWASSLISCWISLMRAAFEGAIILVLIASMSVAKLHFM